MEFAGRAVNFMNNFESHQNRVMDQVETDSRRIGDGVDRFNNLYAEFKAAFTVTNDMINEQVDRVNNFHDKLEASFS